MKKCTNKFLWEHANVPIQCVKRKSVFKVWTCISLLIVLLLSGCGDGTSESSVDLKEDITKRDTEQTDSGEYVGQMFRLLHLKNGDAKFYGNNVVTSVDGKLNLLNRDGTTLAQYDINANWISVLEDERIIVYGNSDKAIGICQLNEANEIVDNNVILKSELLMIDPSILKCDNRYFLTVTYIDGNVNNANPDTPNGRYTVKLYVSNDLKNWEFLSDIVDVYSNIEDVRLYNIDGRLQLVYEQEVFDKGRSCIRIKESEDFGITWGESRLIVDYDGDNEPGFLHENETDGYLFYYSSDRENPGESYDKANIYTVRLDENFMPEGECKKVEVDDTEGRLLFDVRICDDRIYFLCEGNYIKDGNLILEEYNRRN